MQNEGLILPLVQVAGNEKGVNLLTAHGAKGLEFEYVFFAGCTSGCWEKKRKPFSGFNFPDTLFGTQTARNDTEELRRLFYVAVTRAKKHLYISFSNYTIEGKPLEPSVFIAEILEHHILPTEKIILDTNVITGFGILQFKEALMPEVAHLEDELENRALQGFYMSVSALNTYLRCPLAFYYQYIVRIPAPKNEAAEFGSAVHHALEQLFRKMLAAGNFPPVDVFVDDFTWYMRRHHECFTREQFARRLEYGQQILVDYYREYTGAWNKTVIIEHNIRNVVLDDILLRGKIDKIEFKGKDALIVDYKTGDAEKCREKLARPGEKDPNGGDYWRQAVFYKIIADLYSNKGWNITTVDFDFVEPDHKKQYRREKIVITDADITTVKQQIITVWGKVQNRDFYTGCGKDDCPWCGFVKTNKLAVALHELHEDEEERGRTPLLRLSEPGIEGV
jgi:DNA helicase-2/ATP-dependent DNA helicase PcrA